MRLITVFSLALFMMACGSGPKYALDPPEPIEPKIKIATQWVAHVGEKHERQQSQLPVKVVDDKIYLANTDGAVGVMELNTGKVLWQSQMKERITAGPGFDDKVIVVANNEAEVIAMEEGSGKELWRQKVSSEVITEPVVTDTKVFVQTIDGKIFALAKDSGKKLWIDGREIPALTLRGNSRPIVAGTRLLVGFASGELVAYNIDSGKVEWETAIAVPRGRTDLERIVDIDGLFYLDGDTVYVVSYQGKIAAVALEDGRTVWSRDMSSYAGLVVDERQIYVTDEKGFVWALDRSSGATLWRQEKLADRQLTTPVLLGNAVVVADVGGYIFWLSRDDGAFLAQVDLYRTYYANYVHWNDEVLEDKDYGVTTYMTVADNRLLVRDNEGSLVVFTIAE